MRLTTDKNMGPKVVDEIIEATEFDRELIPRIPVIFYYNPEGKKIFTDDREEVFLAFRAWTEYHKHKGYYCEIETEWWDDNDVYQGPTGKRNYRKYHFGTDEITELPEGLFKFNYWCCVKLNKIRYEREEKSV